MTRRESLLTVLAGAIAVAGCGGGGAASVAAVNPGAAGNPSPGSGPVTPAPAPAAPAPGTGAVAPGPDTGAANPAAEPGSSTPAASPPKVANNRIAVFGDSRTADATQDSTTAATNRVTADAYIGYAMIASNFRGDFTGSYGVNNDTLQGMLDRLGPTTQTRGRFLSADPGLSAGIVIFLGGVNNTASPIGTTGPLYQSILSQLANAGKTVIVCNEVPSNTTGVEATEQVARRTYLDSVSIGENDGRIIRVNTFDPLLQPGTANTSKPGYYGAGDGLHPGPMGNRVIGELVGAELERILSAAGYPSRSAKVPTQASQSVLPHAMLTGTAGVIAPEAAGDGGTNRNGANGTGVVGPVADGWTFSRDARLAALLNAAQPVSAGTLSVTLAKGRDADGFETQVVTVNGQVGVVDAIYNLTFANVSFVSAADMVSGVSNGIGIADGDTVYGAARIKVSAAAKGLLGPGLEVLVSGPSALDTGHANLSGTICPSNRDWRTSAAFDKLVLSQPRVLPAGFAAARETKIIQQQLVISIAGGLPVDFTVEISRFGIIKNP